MGLTTTKKLYNWGTHMKLERVGGVYSRRGWGTYWNIYGR